MGGAVGLAAFLDEVELGPSESAGLALSSCEMAEKASNEVGSWGIRHLPQCREHGVCAGYEKCLT
jgi:hypothetical protein